MEKLPSRPRTMAFGLIVAALSVLIVEAFSYGMARAFLSGAFFRAEDYTLADRQQLTARELFDHDLGWSLKFDTQHGERPRKESFDANWLATFGDSFTFGAEVKDDETWQAYLSQDLRQDVYNFGVWSYGLGQSYLRFKKVYPTVRSRFVALGLITENINRTMNSYRPFYFRKSGAPLPFPTFRLDHDNLALVPNPLRDVDDLARLKDPSFIETLAAREYLFKVAPPIFLRPPFTYALIKASIRAIQNKSASDLVGQPSLDLWRDEYARTVVFRLLRRFRDEALISGGTPFVLLYPTKVEVVAGLRSKAPGFAASALMQQASALDLPLFDGIAALTKVVKARGAIDDLFAPGGHLSSEGNRQFASLVREFMDRRFSRLAIDSDGMTAGERPRKSL